MTALVPVTGRGESFVLWDLPYSRGLAYLHALGVQNGATMELVSGDGERRGGMREGFENLKAQWEDKGGEGLTQGSRAAGLG